ncbi:MAG: T9SS type A sorting domain-containing protein [Bacteroidia bacterium]|nr:T9SS type A sorting domain-containing protein [Bacteroidia bacterium]
MKKIISSITLFLSVLTVNSQVTIAEWNFPNNPDDATIDGGIASNAAKTISTVGGTSAIVYSSAGATTNCAEATSWNAGNGTKYWFIDIVTTGYNNLTITSKQRSGGNGPRDFKIQYKIGAGAWTDAGITTTAGNGVWNTLAVTALPVACNNQASVQLRWIMNSDTQADGGAGVAAAPVSRIDDIIISSSCQPTTQASSFTSSSITATSMTIGWTRGNGNNVMVIALAGSAPTDPTSGTSYTANSVYGSGSAVGGGFCVYNGTGTSVNVTGLTAGVTYYYAIYEYNTSGTCYNLTQLTGNAPTESFDICAGALPTACGGTYTGSTLTATTTGDPSGTCGTLVGAEGVWYTFAGDGNTITASLCNAGTDYDTKINVYSGSCGSLTCVGGNDDGATCGTESEYTWTSALGTTYYIFVNGYSGAQGNFELTITCAAPTPPECADYTSPSNGAQLCAAASTTLNWTAPTSGDSPTSYLLYYGTNNPPTNIVNGTDIGNVLSYTTGAISAGNTYYWQIVPKNAAGNASGCAIQNFSVVTTPSNDDPCSATAITVGSSCSFTTYTNACATGTTAGSPPAPGCASYSGGDVWFSCTVPASGSLTFDSNPGVVTDGGMAIYSGTCGALTLISCNANAGVGAMPKITATGLTAGATIFIRFWEEGNNNNGTFSLCVYDPCPGGSPANDACSAAEPLPLGTTLSGNNGCSSATGEPGAATCWSGGTLNTVWYSVTAPASGQLKIRTTLVTIGSTQIALYSGVCGSLTQVGCNQSAPACDWNSYSNSELTVTGLTAGATYYIRVDGQTADVGTFNIIAIDGTSSFPAIPGQDCTSPLPVCNSTMTIGDPGYQALGNICDFTGTSNCTDGEKGSAWYTINIANTGTLEFNIIPNDASGTASCGAETDYDFIMWKLSGTGATSCASIQSSGGGSVAACNFDGYGVTGLSSTGNAPSPYSICFDGAYEPAIAVTAGETYVLVIQNFSNSTSGFTLDFTNTVTGTINYTGVTSLSWTGGAATTAWGAANNWGSCAVPDCSIDANITAASFYQPVITGNVTVKNLTINSGATLTLSAGSTLTICGDITNNGTIVASPTSTIIFNDNSTTHQMTGNFVGTSKLGNLTVTDVAGSTNCTVTLNSSMDLGGNFTTSNSTSIFNSNGKYITLAGNFVNSNGNTTFSNTGSTGTLEFNGTAAQTYTAGSSQLDLNNVVMNHTGAGVTLLSNMNVKTTTGTLTLTSGKIITNAFEVNVANTATTSVSTGNTTSFVQGNLRRSLLSTGSYDFPVGHATPGYQRANVNFTAATSIGNLLARFDTWPSTPPIQGGTDCGATFNQQAENNGYWTITANANPTTGTYNMTLYPLNATNTAGMSGWTIMKDPLISSNTWSLNGTCVVTSTATQVMRNGMNGFSVYGAAQSLTPLPIELISFTGKNLGKRNLLEWTTATEHNNDFFTLERSKDGYNFETLSVIDGAGSSSSTINYNKYDESPFFGLTYYRLKQTDFNGDYSHSEILAIENSLDDIELSNVHPNPTSNDINFDFYSPIAGTIKVQVLDYTGRVVIEENMVISNGKTRLNAKMGELAKGIYSLKVTFDQTGYSSVNMIIKQ